MLVVKDQVFKFPKCLPISRQNLVTFGNIFNVLHGKTLVVTVRKVQMGNLTVYSTDNHSFALPFSFPLIKISKTHTKKRICSGFFYRKYNAFREPDQQPYSFGFSRWCSADLQIKVTQLITVS